MKAANIEPFYRHLGRKIHDRRKQQGLSQQKLGQLLDPQVTRASIANIEMGAQRVLVHTLTQLAFHLRTSVPQLLPKVEIRTNGRDEGAVILKELNKQLDLPQKQVEQLVKKLKRRTSTL
jgi:transcriptional regulator with XRE-family HTH domain